MFVYGALRETERKEGKGGLVLREGEGGGVGEKALLGSMSPANSSNSKKAVNQL